MERTENKFTALLHGVCNPDLFQKLSFIGAEVTGQWRLRFSAPCALTAKETESLHAAVKQVLPEGVSFFIEVQTEERPENIKDALMQGIAAEKPFCAALLADAQWAYNPPELLITLQTAVAESLEKAGVPLFIEDLAKKHLSVRLRVALCECEHIDEDTLRERHAAKAQQIGEELAAAAPPPPAAPEPVKGEIQIYGKKITAKPVALSSLDELSDVVTVEGDVFEFEAKTLRDNKKQLFIFSITDYTSSIVCKLFLPSARAEVLKEELRPGTHILLEGQCVYDKFSNERVLQCRSMQHAAARPRRQDNAPEKRTELHLHTRLSQMDSVASPKALVAALKRFGHKAVAITDHGVVQAFPDMEAEIAKQKADIKLIFGVEAYMADDAKPFLHMENAKEGADLFELPYVVFDIETTGLRANSDAIIEIAGVKVTGGEQGETFSAFVNPKRHIPEKITELTGINNSMVMNAPPIEEVLPAFLEFCKGSVLVAHNAGFDCAFVRVAANRLGLSYRFAQLDTLALARYLLPELKSHKLGKICAALDIRLVDAHRAINDAQATAAMFVRLLGMLRGQEITHVNALNAVVKKDMRDTFHTVLLAKNKTGLQNLYRLITDSHLKHFHKRPCMPKSLIEKHREGILIGSACEAGELFSACLAQEPEETLAEIAAFYDYLEVQPLGNNQFLLDSGALPDPKALQNLNKRIIALGEKLGKPVIAAGDVHFTEPEDCIFREIIQNAQGFSDTPTKSLYLHTTEEMLQAFSYIPEPKRSELVIHTPARIADMCEKMESFPRDKLYTPKMEGAEEEIRQMAYENAHAMYGNPLPEIVEKRLERELDAIIRHGFAVLYLIAHKVVKKSLSDGYLVGSRGSVGSSFAATMTGITEVNPLTPHYVCPQCHNADFSDELKKYGCGVDMPKRLCEKCGTDMLRQGYDIPFEVFMGFDGDKAPDIDLNFSGEYQPIIHKYIEDLFGAEYVFRAGTISGVAEKTAMGYVLKYCEERGKDIPGAEKRRLAAGCIDVKRTTGQHPGGMVVLPKEHSIYEFTPLQHPANDASKGVITTHFDFNSLHDTMLKLDILGHDDPTTIRMLEKLTGVDATKIALDDPNIIKLFQGTEVIGVDPEALGSQVATFGVPEFGTAFVRKMLMETKPTCIADLVRISGLSHGTDVWTNNAQDYVQKGVATLPELICTREDIMLKLQAAGINDTLAFKTMESVRKGRGLSPEMREAIEGAGIKDWIVESLTKIKYMFPKAHAAAYVTMALRCVYFKIYYPQAFYTAYFSVRADDFEIGLMQGGVESLRAAIKELAQKPDLNAREKGIMSMMEIAVEMKLRGIDFANLDIYKSSAHAFIPLEDGRILPPFTAIAGLGGAAAESIVQEREKGEFTSIADIVRRTSVSKTVMEMLQNTGCLRGIPQSEQMDFFELD